MSEAILVKWEDTKSEYHIFVDKICWAFYDDRTEELTLYMENGQTLQLDGKEAKGMNSMLYAYHTERAVLGGKIGV